MGNGYFCFLFKVCYLTKSEVEKFYGIIKVKNSWLPSKARGHNSLTLSSWWEILALLVFLMKAFN
jgi:hypothetical protein